MTLHEDLAPRAPDPALGGIIKLAVMAVGGQGGGVLAGWIESVGRAGGYAVQATSVAGVAQRTGATIYYIEMAPRPAPTTGRQPVFSLMPSAGDVDILVAAEMMEAGRAILRGFVTPDRTTLIASTHRALAVSEKTVPGDGIASSEEVRAAIGVAARRAILFDMDRLAIDHGSVISASLFGALAGSGALPFARPAFRAAVAAGGKGAEASLAAFEAAADMAEGGGDAPQAASDPVSSAAITGPARLLRDWLRLSDRIAALPEPVRAMAGAGLRKVVDFQDCAYGGLYLDRLERVLAADRPGAEWELTREAAKHIANAMAYDDVIRVADLKTRAARMVRIGGEMGAGEGRILALTEFFHPRADEIVGMLPARMGARWRADPARMAWLDRWFGKGRRIRSDRVLPFLILWLAGGLRGWRVHTLRHADETAHLEGWLSEVLAVAGDDPALAAEMIRCRRLIKGYSDTHARGLSKFDRVMEGARLLRGRADAADWTRRLREAALMDEEGKALEGALATVRSFL
ncbi:MAG: indolepyruvate oxidoreductase subunit beta family protein [Proteobacteria bacterium]|nr:indolepyruvate oxidoreductase subunit beta family protein [Pseudomonadota bacterium]MBS0573685.1 indolepyruvate oxidoreductase subunit beta family protein [Pseudomonadota bacterium]